MTKIKRIFITILAIIGFITTIELVIIYAQANFNPYALPSFCSVNSFIDCDSVAKTDYSQFLGIPLALWGMFLYITILILAFADKLKRFRLLSFFEVFKHPNSYIYCLAMLSFIISIALASISIFKIQKICIMCFITYFLDLFIAIVSRSWGKGLGYDIKTSISDLIDALKIKKYLIAFISLLILAVSFLTYIKTSYILTPQVKKHESYKYFANMKTNPYKVSGNQLGDADAKIIIKSFTDYNCAGCYISNLMLHRVVLELKGVKVIHYHMPLDTDCNKNMKKQGHIGSCLMARYAVAAEMQGKFWDMNDLLFEKTPKTEEEILKLAKQLHLDTKKLKEDANSDVVEKKVEDNIELAKELDVNGTPTMLINMNKTLGILPYYELKEKLIDIGATERK